MSIWRNCHLRITELDLVRDHVCKVKASESVLSNANFRPTSPITKFNNYLARTAFGSLERDREGDGPGNSAKMHPNHIR